MIYITGDTHRDFTRIKTFCERQETTKNDLLIILGDAGINYYDEYEDRALKQYLERFPITFLCVRGNHEERPENIKTYKKEFITNKSFEGNCFYEQEFPNLYFLDNGIFKLKTDKDHGYTCLNINGAYSPDKYYRLIGCGKWFKDEQLTEEEKKKIVDQLPEKVDFVFSHTCPEKYIPREVFLPNLDQSTVDRSMEGFLDKIESRLDYKKWYCGHWHIDKKIDKMIFLFNAYEAIMSEK